MPLVDSGKFGCYYYLRCTVSTVPPGSSRRRSLTPKLLPFLAVQAPCLVHKWHHPPCQCQARLSPFCRAVQSVGQSAIPTPSGPPPPVVRRANPPSHPPPTPAYPSTVITRLWYKNTLIFLLREFAHDLITPSLACLRVWKAHLPCKAHPPPLIICLISSAISRIEPFSHSALFSGRVYLVFGTGTHTLAFSPVIFHVRFSFAGAAVITLHAGTRLTWNRLVPHWTFTVKACFPCLGI